LEKCREREIIDRRYSYCQKQKVYLWYKAEKNGVTPKSVFSLVSGIFCDTSYATDYSMENAARW